MNIMIVMMTMIVMLMMYVDPYDTDTADDNAYDNNDDDSVTIDF